MTQLRIGFNWMFMFKKYQVTMLKNSSISVPNAEKQVIQIIQLTPATTLCLSQART